MVWSFSGGVTCITDADNKHSDGRILAPVFLPCACVIVKQGKVGGTPLCSRIELSVQRFGSSGDVEDL